MEYAEKYAQPVQGTLGPSFPRRNVFNDLFYLRWGQIHFRVFWGQGVNLKVILAIYRTDGVCEHSIVDTDAYAVTWNAHHRVTRDFFVHPFPRQHGRISCAKFSYIVHIGRRSIPSRSEYIFMDGGRFETDGVHVQPISEQWATPNTYRTYELDAGCLQRDVDWINSNFESLHLTPKFTKGQPWHPFHPKRYIHERIDALIYSKQHAPHKHHALKVCVDCIDDTDFINHIIFASQQGIWVQCIVDWRKMMLTNSENYAKLKRSGIELLGVFCTPRDGNIEVSPDMHNKFIIFDEEDCIVGSFNITFDVWGSNWESGMTFHSRGVCRLLDNIFQGLRGGVIQGYGIDPFSHFNVLYTFGRQLLLSGKPYRPHQAILAEINRAKVSIKLCLFLIGELRGEYGDSVIDALIRATYRGVDVQIILNGHMVREGDPGRACPMSEELRRPLLPSVRRLQQAGLSVALAYGQIDRPVVYCPLHAKYAIIDGWIVLDGSFNWYNTSVSSHDILIVVANAAIAQAYVHEFSQIRRLFRFA